METYQQRKDRLERKSDNRVIRIINASIGKHRVFSGKVQVSKGGERNSATDEEHLRDIKSTYDDGKALAYWTDGSHRFSADLGWNAVLGAGVAWQERNHQGAWAWETQMFSLGVNTGSSEDAELYGIASALRLAVEKAERNLGRYEHVRILSDCVRVLSGIQEGSITTLGPAVSSPWALQQVYDYTDTLVQMGVDVQLVWVKGHAQSVGNRHADQAAKEGVQMQTMMMERRGGWVLKKNVPELIAMMGERSVEEWNWRVNEERLCRGEEEVEEKEEEKEAPPPPPPPHGPQPPPPPPPPESEAGSEDMDISDDDDTSMT